MFPSLGFHTWKKTQGKTAEKKREKGDGEPSMLSKNCVFGILVVVLMGFSYPGQTYTGRPMGWPIG